MKGILKFGMYELLKVLYYDLMGEEKEYVWRK